MNIWINTTCPWTDNINPSNSISTESGTPIFSLYILTRFTSKESTEVSLLQLPNSLIYDKIIKDCHKLRKWASNTMHSTMNWIGRTNSSWRRWIIQASKRNSLPYRLLLRKWTEPTQNTVRGQGEGERTIAEGDQRLRVGQEGAAGTTRTTGTGASSWNPSPLFKPFQVRPPGREYGSGHGLLGLYGPTGGP